MPIRLNYLPRDVAVVAAFRPAEILKHPEHERLLDSWVIGTLADEWKTTVPRWAGTGHDGIEQVVLGLVNESPEVRAACVKIAVDAANAVGITFSSIDVVRVDGAWRVLEINSGVMMEALGKLYPELVQATYDAALDRVFGGRK